MRRKKKMSNLKKVTITFVILVMLWIFGFYLYITYKNIEINPSNYEATQILSTRKCTNCGKSRRK